MPEYLPGYEWCVNARNGGGTYDPEGIGYPWRICIHTIEGSIGDHPWTHPTPPHIWYDPATRAKYQTVPLSRSAFALWQSGDAASPYTNKARALQVELAGRAATAGEWSDEWLRHIAEDVIVPFVEFVREQGADINLDHVPAIGVIAGSASEFAPQRLSYEAWTSFDGVCSHRHVCDNDHWDSGTLNVLRIVELAKKMLGGDLPLNAADFGTIDALVGRAANNVHAAVQADVRTAEQALQARAQTLEVNLLSWLQQAEARDAARDQSLANAVASVIAALERHVGGPTAGPAAEAVAELVVEKLAKRLAADAVGLG